jgi:predicted metal-dependent enzyme (double-stranded beta helix superfamily)
MFELERFIAECESACVAGGRQAVREILARAIADRRGVVAALGEPRLSEVKVLHRSPRLTILNALWPPHHTQAPHNHLLWVEIGVYSGREDNIIWRRSPAGSEWPIEAVGATSLCAGSCHSLADDVIHSVNNPLDRITAALHVYGGDLLAAPRSMWDSETLMEGPIDLARDIRAIDAYNGTLQTGGLSYSVPARGPQSGQRQSP